MKVSYSQLGHQYHRYANPLSEKKIEEAIRICSESEPGRAIDIGTGNGYILGKFLGKACKEAVGIDNGTSEAEFLNREGLQLVCGDANKYLVSIPDNFFTVGICIGSCHALGGYEKTLVALKQKVSPGGYIVIGDGYWQCKPDPAYLEFLGAPEEELMSHAGNLKCATAHDLIPIWATTASSEEWDNYEWYFSKGIEDFFRANPDHPQRDEILGRIASWREAVWEWGRKTLGFGLYVYRLR